MVRRGRERQQRLVERGREARDVTLRAFDRGDERAKIDQRSKRMDHGDRRMLFHHRERSRTFDDVAEIVAASELEDERRYRGLIQQDLVERERFAERGPSSSAIAIEQTSKLRRDFGDAAVAIATDARPRRQRTINAFAQLGRVDPTLANGSSDVAVLEGHEGEVLGVDGLVSTPTRLDSSELDDS